MSDFYQIIQREIEAKKNSAERFDVIKNDGSKNELPKKTPVKKYQKKSIRPLLKKRKKTAVEKLKKNIIYKKTLYKEDQILSLEAINPIWLSLSEAAKIGGTQKITIKRAIKNGDIKFKIVDNRYQVDLRSAILFFSSRKKLWNKLKEFGIGQYVEKWIT